MPLSASTPDAPLSRRERERLSRREAMLEAARIVFAEKGYDAARLDEIADRAEFGKGTLYNYFEGGKVELLFAIVEHELDGMRARIEQAIERERTAHRPLRTVLRDLMADLVRHFEGSRETFLIISKELPRILFSTDREQAMRLHNLYTRTVFALVPLLETAMASGAMRRLDPIGVAFMLVSNLQTVIEANVLHQSLGDACCGADLPFPDPARAADLLASLLLDGLVPDPAALCPTLPAPVAPVASAAAPVASAPVASAPPASPAA